MANGAPPDGAQAASAAGAVAAEEAPVDVVTAGRPSRRAQVVAAVAAALAAAMESGASGPAVRHGRQTRTRRPQMDWARAGRMELVTARERLPRVRGARS